MATVLTTTTTIQLGATGPTLNSIDGNGVIWRVNQDGFTGWGEPGTTLAPQQNIRASNTWSGDAFTKGRDMTISGTITAPTPALLNAAIDSLINAVTASGFTLTVTESGVAATSVVRRSGETLTPKITNLMAAYSIAVHADDARKFGTPLVGTTAQPVSSGGKTWPETWPEAWSATTISGTVTLINPGNRTGTVVLRIDGPCVAPQIVHQGTGAPVTFRSSYTVAAGNWLTINLETHQTLENDQANRAQYITAPGWSGFDPGVNTWALSADVYNAATLLTVTATPARK